MSRAFLPAALFALATAAAFGQTPFGEGTPPGGLDGGTPVQSAARCQECHDRESSIEPELYMPYDGWVSSMMGNAMRDPLFHAALSVANQDKPGVGQWCLKCHSPQGWVRDHTLPADGGAMDELDREGITCDVCHRALPGPDAGFIISNAQFYWELTGVKHGPYENVSSPAHLGQQSALHSDSALCGSCHQIENPFVAWKQRDGGSAGRGFPLDTTYEEWSQSSFSSGPSAMGCVGCHMKVFEGQHGVAAFGPARSNPRRHTFAGGNVWGLDAVLAANPELSAYQEQFEQTRRLTLETLKSAARLTLTAPSSVDAGEPFEVVLEVENQSGHKLPTGYAEGRRVFVELSVNGRVISGEYLADAGELVVDPQLRVYEAFHGRLGMGRSEHLALHDSVIKDSRIPPRGLRVTPATAPVGVTWFDLPDGGVSHVDRIAFLLPGQSSGAGEVRARLLYQSTTREYVDFLVAENRTDATGQKLAAIYAQTDRAPPIELASISSPLTVAELDAPPLNPDGSCGPNGCCCTSVGAYELSLLGGLLTALLAHRRRPRTP